MTTRRALSLLLLLAVVMGLMDGQADWRGMAPSRALDVAYAVVMAVVAYLWLRRDAQARHHPVGVMLSGLVIVCSVVGIPVYLLRSRPAGERLGAVGRFFGFVVVAIAASVLVAVPFFLLGPG
jgi:hypothetical protein